MRNKSNMRHLMFPIGKESENLTLICMMLKDILPKNNINVKYFTGIFTPSNSENEKSRQCPDHELYLAPKASETPVGEGHSPTEMLQRRLT
jgi:hypothetical protein